jgi:hypothetical protein
MAASTVNLRRSMGTMGEDDEVSQLVDAPRRDPRFRGGPVLVTPVAERSFREPRALRRGGPGVAGRAVQLELTRVPLVREPVRRSRQCYGSEKATSASE